MKLSMLGDPSLAAGVFECEQQGELERRIKQRLHGVYDEWCADLDAPLRPVRSTEGDRRMRLAICTISFRHHVISLDELASFAQAERFYGIELWEPTPRTWLTNPSTAPTGGRLWPVRARC